MVCRKMKHRLGKMERFTHGFRRKSRAKSPQTIPLRSGGLPKEPHQIQRGQGEFVDLFGRVWSFQLLEPQCDLVECSEFYHVLQCLLVHIDAYGCTSKPINPFIPLSFYPSTHLRAGLHAYRPLNSAQSTAFPFFPMIHVTKRHTELVEISLARSILEKAGFPAFTRRSTLLS